jgi:hypothetical protein
MNVVLDSVSGISQNSVIHITAKILQGTNESNQIFLKDGTCVIGLYMPNLWTAASIYFRTLSEDGAIWAPVANPGTGLYRIINPSVVACYHFGTNLLSCRSLIIRSGNFGAAINQNGDRTFVLAVRSLA